LVCYPPNSRYCYPQTVDIRGIFLDSAIMDPELIFTKLCGLFYDDTVGMVAWG
jgi:hypothetical protein